MMLWPVWGVGLSKKAWILENGQESGYDEQSTISTCPLKQPKLRKHGVFPAIAAGARASRGH
jgi:hypothetical protein